MKVKEKPKEKEKPKKTGPATDEKPAEKQEQVKRGVDAATESKVKNAFGKSSGAGSGKQGSPNGNNPTGALSGKPGIGGLDGYTLCPGIVCEELNGSGYVAVPFRDEGEDRNGSMEIGYLTKKQNIISKIGRAYIGELRKSCGASASE